MYLFSFRNRNTLVGTHFVCMCSVLELEIQWWVLTSCVRVLVSNKETRSWVLSLCVQFQKCSGARSHGIFKIMFSTWMLLGSDTAILRSSCIWFD